MPVVSDSEYSSSSSGNPPKTLSAPCGDSHFYYFLHPSNIVNTVVVTPELIWFQFSLLELWLYTCHVDEEQVGISRWHHPNSKADRCDLPLLAVMQQPYSFVDFEIHLKGACMFCTTGWCSNLSPTISTHYASSRRTHYKWLFHPAECDLGRAEKLLSISILFMWPLSLWCS